MQVRQTHEFAGWINSLRDKRARERIELRLDRLKQGHAGVVKSVGSSVSELKIDYGPGYRVYLMRRGELVIVLLCGGDKRTQSKDIERAHKLAAEWKEDSHGT